MNTQAFLEEASGIQRELINIRSTQVRQFRPPAFDEDQDDFELQEANY